MSVLPTTNEWGLSVFERPHIPDPIVFINKAGDEKIVFSVCGIDPNEVFGTYRIASSVLHLIPATDELGSRLLQQATPESFWSPSIQVKQIFFQFKEEEKLFEVLPGVFDKTVTFFNQIIRLAEDRKIDLIRVEEKVIIKGL